MPQVHAPFGAVHRASQDSHPATESKTAPPPTLQDSPVSLQDSPAEQMFRGLDVWVPEDAPREMLAHEIEEVQERE